MKDVVELSTAVKVNVVELSSSSHVVSRKVARVLSRVWSLLGARAMTMLSVTVLPMAMTELVEVRLALGVGVPPAADLVVEGLGVLLGLGRLVMDSEG